MEKLFEDIKRIVSPRRFYYKLRSTILVEYYVKVLKNYFNFSGRARPEEFWLFTLCNYFVGLVLGILKTLTTYNPALFSIYVVAIAYVIAITPAWIALAVRRLHDTNRSGNWMYIALTGVGIIWLFVLMCLKGTSSDNKYGCTSKIKTFPKGGVHPPENKFSAGNPIETLPLPAMVTIPLSQHIGAPAIVCVKVGDRVKTGQMIAKSAGFVSTNIHSSVSGTVRKIDSFLDASGYKRPAVQIAVEGDEWVDGIDTSSTMKTGIIDDAEEITRKIAAAGIVGLGGATFPTHVKLSVPPGKKAEMIVINGVECEPYLTCDHRLMLEKGPEIIMGIRILMKALNVNKAIVGVENNKPDAIANLKKYAATCHEIEICSLQVKYPQGGEKQLIKAVTEREVPPGKIPIDIGVVPFNVASVFAVYEAVQKNKPLVERLVTVTGRGLSKPSNFKVRIGTPVNSLIEAAGGMPNHVGKIVNGGPMMGKAMGTVDVPVTKACSGILLIGDWEAKRQPACVCIRCAKCVDACPMGLEPYLLMPLAERQLYDRTEEKHVTDCIECGSCSYTCPSMRPLLDYIRLGKAAVLKNIRARAMTK